MFQKPEGVTEGANILDLLVKKRERPVEQLAAAGKCGEGGHKIVQLPTLRRGRSDDGFQNLRQTRDWDAWSIGRKI